jgi:hypothetical protein
MTNKPKSSRKRKVTKDEQFFKQLEKIKERPWEILKQPGLLEVAQQRTRRPRPGHTEIVWDGPSFEKTMLTWFRGNPVPEFLVKK